MLYGTIFGNMFVFLRMNSAGKSYFTLGFDYRSPYI